jgi:hypothetical protein
MYLESRPHWYDRLEQNTQTFNPETKSYIYDLLYYRISCQWNKKRTDRRRAKKQASVTQARPSRSTASRVLRRVICILFSWSKWCQRKLTRVATEPPSDPSWSKPSCEAPTPKSSNNERALPTSLPTRQNHRVGSPEAILQTTSQTNPEMPLERAFERSDNNSLVTSIAQYSEPDDLLGISLTSVPGNHMEDILRTGIQLPGSEIGTESLILTSEHNRVSKISSCNNLQIEGQVESIPEIIRPENGLVRHNWIYQSSYLLY